MKRRLHNLYNHWRAHGTKSTIHIIILKIKTIIAKAPIPAVISASFIPGVKEMIRARFTPCAPLPVYSIARNGPMRISMVTDSVNAGSLFGGVGTAIIFAALLAEARQSRLRIVTRTERANPENIAHVLTTYNIHLTHEIEFAFISSHLPNNEMDIFEDELFITTLWWTTEAVMGSIRHDLIIWLLQEDERMFYPPGDDYLRCERVLKSDTIHFVVNTQLLFDHFLSDLPHIAHKGIWFEPAFPHEVFHRQEKQSEHKLKFMFYARPNNLRNLFYFGIELIEEAISRGIIDLSRWDIIFVGKDIPPLFLANHYNPQKFENLSWQAYAQLIGSVDLGLCLMHTPHPSYPPLDLAASGAVAVTNCCGNKQDLKRYSKNILSGQLDKESMMDTLKQGVELALNVTLRQQNYSANTLMFDWGDAFSKVIQQHTRAH